MFQAREQTLAEASTSCETGAPLVLITCTHCFPDGPLGPMLLEERALLKNHDTQAVGEAMAEGLSSKCKNVGFISRVAKRKM